MQTVKLVIVILICLMVLGACGLKGPLYLPSESPVAETANGQETDPGKDETEKKQDTTKKESGINNK